MTAQPYCLLGPDDGHPVEMHRAEGGSPFFLTCEHAGREIPRRLGDLGVEESELRRHIAWDIGAAEVARGLSARLDATLILQTYSRLVIDCNRTIDSHDSIPTVSEHTEIPGNRNLHPDEAAARVDEVFRPYHDSAACASATTSPTRSAMKPTTPSRFTANAAASSTSNSRSVRIWWNRRPASASGRNVWRIG